jgi:uncharacterized protein YbjT (DUF2867 family)
MSNVLVLGAGGQISRHVIGMLDGEQGVALTLFARNTGRLTRVPANATLVQGDVLDAAGLAKTVKGQDIVYANLTGEDLDGQANAVVAAMRAEAVPRLVFVLSLGIYREIPGKFGAWNEAIIGEDLKPFRRAADAIEASGLDYTILRPAWLTDEDEVDYETTGRNEPFKGTVVSRKSVADLIARTIRAPELHSRANLGVNKPNTNADKPYFM